MSELIEKAKENIKNKGLPIVEDEKTLLPLYVDMREFPIRYQLGISKIRKFFDGLTEGKIYATQCEKCGEKFFPPRADCPKCLDSTIKWVPLNCEGELITHTIVYIKPPSFSHYKDYAIGIARLNDGLKVLAWINTDNPKELKPKTKVRLVTAKREPEGIITYELTPTEKHSPSS
ncbi:MAG: Zn-ribbon domain-containing OB-fold protein [Candidatus Bathyarchaeia archaeon]